ncbi:MAG: hypothetical protein FJ297_11775 [Planctomycetes bacterium]|nr:hypothetical protein [Planctomycetota bacterium]
MPRAAVVRPAAPAGLAAVLRATVVRDVFLGDRFAAPALVAARPAFALAVFVDFVAAFFVAAILWLLGNGRSVVIRGLASWNARQERVAGSVRLGSDAMRIVWASAPIEA